MKKLAHQKKRLILDYPFNSKYYVLKSKDLINQKPITKRISVKTKIFSIEGI